MPRMTRDEDLNLLRMALLEGSANALPGRAPSGIAHNAYLASIQATYEQAREANIINEGDRRYFANREGDRARQSKVDDMEALATMRNFETRRGVKEDGGTLAGSPSPDGVRTIRRFTQSGAPTDADTAASATQKAMRDPRVLAEQVRNEGDLAEINARPKPVQPDTGEADATRDEIIRLAEEIKDSGYLDANVGPLDNSSWNPIPTMRGGSKDFQAKAERLRSLLSLEARGKLKGQGAVSDFEGKMLRDSQSSLNLSVDEGSFRNELDRIIKEQQKKGTGGVRRFNPATGNLEP